MQTYALSQTVAPTEEPVSLEELKDHCRVDLDDDDALLLSFGVMARESLEIETARQFLTATYVMALDMFPGGFMRQAGSWSYWDGIRVPRPPLQSVTSITYTDTAGATQTLATSVYGVDIYSEPGRIYLKPSQIWPSTYDVPNAVLITFVAGWTDTTKMPQALKQAIKLWTADAYENREASAEKSLTEIPLGVRRLVWLNRIIEAA